MDKEAQMCSEQLKYTESKSEPVPSMKDINLEQPPNVPPVVDIQSDMKSLEIKESPKKTDDLEDWLDSVLDD